jgi:hypothetical protein
MNKATYKAHAQSIRANGVHHGLKWIADCLEREDMAFLENQWKTYDHLTMRLGFQKLGEVETPRNAFMLTTTAKVSK